MAMALDVCVFFLFTSARRANVRPEIIPKKAPFVMLLDILNSGTTRIIPINIAPASRIFLLFRAYKRCHHST